MTLKELAQLMEQLLEVRHLKIRLQSLKQRNCLSNYQDTGSASSPELAALKHYPELHQTFMRCMAKVAEYSAIADDVQLAKRDVASRNP